jgi:uncharacterized protein
LAIAPNASGGFSTLRSYTGSAPLNSLGAIPDGGTSDIAITVTGAAAGDKAIVNFPMADSQGIAAIAGIAVTTNTVTVTMVAIPGSDAEWTAGKTITAQIIK